MQEVITDVAQVTPAWLNLVLRRSGHLSGGEVTGVRELGRATVSNSTVYRLQIDCRGYARLPAALVLKLSCAPDPTRGGREEAFYRVAAPSLLLALRPEELPFVRHFDVAYSPATGCGHVLLEDLSPTHARADPALPPSEPQCEGIVDALAVLHALWWQNPRLCGEIATGYDQAYVEARLAGARHNLAQWLAFMGDRVSAGRRATFGRICAAWPAQRLERLLAGRGVTLINGDAQAANFLYPRDVQRDRVRIVDWENWRAATGTDDLAYMMAAHWYPERRARLEKLLVGRYHKQLLEYGVPDYSWDQCWYDYKASVIDVLFSLVGEWQPARPPSLWYERVERATLAYEDLGCALLLP